MLNKAVLLGGAEQVRAREGAEVISAITGEGSNRLCAATDWHMVGAMERVQYEVADGAAIAWLYEHGEVIKRQDGKEMVSLEVRLSPADRLGSREGEISWLRNSF